MPRIAKKADKPNGASKAAKTQEHWDQWFGHFIETGGNMSRACELARISRDAVYYRRESDPEFEARFQAAKQRGTDRMEDSAVERAVEGMERPVFYMGEECGTIREYSDALMQFMLKANRPDKYKDRSAVETTDNSPATAFKGHDLSRLSKERLVQLREILGEAKVQDAPDLAAAQGKPILQKKAPK